MKCKQACPYNTLNGCKVEAYGGICPLSNMATTKTITNADRIRAMSDEDLAAWIAGMTTVCECCAELNECEAPRGFNRCSHGVEDWLKQPYEGE